MIQYKKIILDMHINTEIELGRPMVWEKNRCSGIGFRYVDEIEDTSVVIDRVKKIQLKIDKLLEQSP